MCCEKSGFGVVLWFSEGRGPRDQLPTLGRPIGATTVCILTITSQGHEDFHKCFRLLNSVVILRLGSQLHAQCKRRVSRRCASSMKPAQRSTKLHFYLPKNLETLPTAKPKIQGCADSPPRRSSARQNPSSPQLLYTPEHFNPPTRPSSPTYPHA